MRYVWEPLDVRPGSVANQNDDRQFTHMIIGDESFYITEAGRAALAAEVCSKDGKPCYVGAMDDKHHRCGTVQCGINIGENDDGV